jgi:glycosyltransferase involved in cell wall biosynthesis
VPETATRGLVAGLDIPPPTRVAVGRGTAIVIGGYCYHPEAAAQGLEIEVDGRRQPAERSRLPRQDVYERLEEGDPGRHHAFRSGFVAMPTLEPATEPRQLELRLVLKLAEGGEASTPIGSVEALPGVAPPEAPTPAFPGGGGPRVAICMATYNPPEGLLERQLDSLREQSHANWVCLISDDGSRPEAVELIERAIGDDPRFALARNPERLGFYGNFERALAMAPAAADFVTLCDQDDYWYPDKVERLLERVRGGAQLAYSDARVVSPDGAEIHPSYWTVRRNNYTNFGSLLMANSVTGAASLFRRDLLDDALPFPPSLANPFHDHWLASVALARGEIAYVDEPLYDYVQHTGAVIGHATANTVRKPVRVQLMERLRNPGDGSRVAYYYNWSQQLLYAEVIRIRCWGRMTAAKRRTLKRLLGADDGVVGLGWLLARRLRRLWGRNETLDRELLYAYALGRRRAVSLWTAGRSRPGRLLPRDASIPPSPNGAAAQPAAREDPA